MMMDEVERAVEEWVVGHATTQATLCRTYQRMRTSKAYSAPATPSTAATPTTAANPGTPVRGG